MISGLNLRGNEKVWLGISFFLVCHQDYNVRFRITAYLYKQIKTWY